MYTQVSFGQVVQQNDSSLIILSDTMINVSDTSIIADSSQDKAQQDNSLQVKISPDALDDIVTTKASDSAIIDAEHNTFYLYGQAEANYKDITVQSGKMEFDQQSSTLHALQIKDSNGLVVSTQQFTQGEEQFTFEQLSYNFKSKRALVKNARSQYGEGFVFSEQVKRNADESIYGYKNLYTTCDLDTPHFGIRAKKIKVIPGQIIASGAANLELEGIPTPLMLPFGIYPAKKGQSSGFILPSYTLEGNRGLGLQRGGYYFAINDYLGATAQFDIFSKGSWAFSGNLQYANRYHYSGNFQLGYNYTKAGEIYLPTGYIRKDFNVQWNHQQDSRARPGTNFNASVNFVTSDYNKLNGMNVNQILDNTFQSSISYSKNWIGKPYTFTSSLRHSQNTQSGEIKFTLPDVNFSISQFNPFQFKKNASGLPKWYEKITMSYSTNLQNTLTFYDSLFDFNKISFDNFNNGMRHDISLGASYNILRYFTLSFNAPYTEYWNTKKVEILYNPVIDGLDTSMDYGFFASRQFGVSTSLATRIYGIKMFPKGKIAGVRHVINPSISFNYTPGFAKPPFEYFYYGYRSRDYYYDYYSPYISPYSPIMGPTNAMPVGAVNFNLNNTLAIKKRNDDSTTTNIDLIDRLNFTTGYNFFADSLNWAPINVYLGSRIKEFLTISAGSTFDLYKYENRRRVNKLLINEGQGIAQFIGGNVSLGFNYRGDKSNEEEQEDAINENEQIAMLLRNGGYYDYYDFNIPFEFHANYSLNARKQFNLESRNKIILSHFLTFGGYFTLTENWQVNFESGYNLTQKEITMTSFNIARDLHCWQMSLNLVPFGPYRSFNFSLNVKSSVLQDLKLIRRKSYLDN